MSLRSGLAALSLTSLIPLAAAAPVQRDDTEARAVRLLDERLHREALYDGRVERGCAAHLATPSSEHGWIDVDLHEEHNPRCGGDPQTFTVLDRFRVRADGHEILWYDVVQAEYVAFDNLCRQRRCAQSRPPQSTAD